MREQIHNHAKGVTLAEKYAMWRGPTMPPVLITICHFCRFYYGRPRETSRTVGEQSQKVRSGGHQTMHKRLNRGRQYVHTSKTSAMILILLCTEGGKLT